MGSFADICILVFVGLICITPAILAAKWIEGKLEDRKAKEKNHE